VRLAEDQHAVEELAAQGADEAFAGRVHPRSLHRGAQDPGAVCRASLGGLIHEYYTAALPPRPLRNNAGHHPNRIFEPDKMMTTAG
jgi:hypothetical protein